MRFVHTNYRVRDIDAPLRFYEALGFERRGCLQFEGSYNIYLGLPGGGDTLELTVNEGREEDLRPRLGLRPHRAQRRGPRRPLGAPRQRGIEPEKPPYNPGGRPGIQICFVADPDGYRTELIDGDFQTPQDSDR